MQTCKAPAAHVPWVPFMFVTSLRPASRWATREYLNLSAGFAGDDRGRGKHCVFFMAVKDVRNGDS